MVQVRHIQAQLTQGAVNLEAWLVRLQAELGIEQIDVIERACRLAEEASRKAGADAEGFVHNSFYAGLEMAEILSDLKLDADTLTAAILYRSVREERISLAEVEQRFGEQVTKLIAGVLQMAAISIVHGGERSSALGDRQRQTENVRKMLIALVNDVRVALIKLAERTWALRAVKNEPEARRQKVAREVFDIYAPLAHRLGIGHIKWELEDIAFRYLSPEQYKTVAKLLDERRLNRDGYIRNVIETLQEQLRANSIEAVMTGRAKHIYSIWRKMQAKQIDFDQVHDIRAIRVLVPNIADCYAVLGIVHSLWRHVPKEFDDYIATPKQNGYRSLHTAVIGPQGKVLEVQIRTHQMHEEAEYGVCSHWLYKGTDKSGISQSYEEKIEWLRQLLQWHEEMGDSNALVEELQLDIEQDRIYVFTPAGHVVDLVKGATPIDFAYRVHTEVGHRCRGAKVNGRIVPLNYHLQTGENVEILTGKTQGPSRDWLVPALGYLAAARTRNKIQHWFKLQDKDKNAAAGRGMLERELQRLALSGVDFERLAPAVNYKAAEDMFAAIGAGDLRMAQVVHEAQEQVEPAPRDHQLHLRLPAEHAPDRAGTDLEFLGVDNLLSHVAGCCKPLPGDDCLGYITVGRGISIHRRDCANAALLAEQDPQRIINVHWRGKTQGTYPVDILIHAFDRPALLRDVTTVLANEAVNVTAINSATNHKNSMAEVRITLEVTNLDILGKVLARVAQLPNVVDVRRVKAGG